MLLIILNAAAAYSIFCDMSIMIVLCIFLANILVCFAFCIYLLKLTWFRNRKLSLLYYLFTLYNYAMLIWFAIILTGYLNLSENTDTSAKY